MAVKHFCDKRSLVDKTRPSLDHQRNQPVLRGGVNLTVPANNGAAPEEPHGIGLGQRRKNELISIESGRECPRLIAICRDNIQSIAALTRRSLLRRNHGEVESEEREGSPVGWRQNIQNILQ